MIAAPKLQELIQSSGLGSTAAVYLRCLRTGQTWAADAGAQIYPASMIKTPLAVAVAAAVEAGELAWETPADVAAGNLTVNDAPSPLALGVRSTVGELVELMLCRSDNIATNVLIDLAGREQATAVLGRLGFIDTAIRRKLSGALPLIDDPAASGRNVHPAHEACELFARIDGGAVPGAARIAKHLSAQYWNSKLPAGLAPGDRFAHKTGDTDEVSHDGGILTLASGERYVLVVYTQLPSGDASDAQLAAFMRALRPHLAPRPQPTR